MEVLSFISKAKMALEKGYLESALAELKSCFKTTPSPIDSHIWKQLQNNFIQISGQYHITKNGDYTNTVSFQESNIQINKVSNNLLTLIGELETHIELDEVKYKSNANTPTEKEKTDIIEITLNRDFKNFSKKDQKRLLNSIEILLQMDEGSIKINKIRSGSVKIYFSLPKDKTKKLLDLFNKGDLSHLDVKTVKKINRTDYNNIIKNKAIEGANEENESKSPEKQLSITDLVQQEKSTIKGSYKVLWIENDADSDLYHLASPVYIEGNYHLDIASNASEAFFYLNERRYDIIIVDVRIPPGYNPEWLSRYEKLQKQGNANSNRLGLELLKQIFGKKGQKPPLKVSQNLAAARYGVFTFERLEELKDDLNKLNLTSLKYKRKDTMMPDTALLDFIEEVSVGLRIKGLL